MAVANIQDRTSEFKSILTQAQRRQAQAKVGSQRRSLLTDAQKAEADGRKPRRSDFARKAADIGRGISGTMGKLEKLAQLARRKTLFDNPVEINELTFVIKQDLSGLNQQIAGLQDVVRSSQQGGGKSQESEHNKNVVLLLQGKLTDVSASFRETLEMRTKTIQASRSRQENFLSSVSTQAQVPLQQSASPLYGTPKTGTPVPGGDTLSLNPVGDQQLLMMEEAQPQNTYIQQRGEAIEAIEKTITELGSIFGQLATMVSEQTEMIERIDANTDDVVDNVGGAQRELLKYWSSVSSNRWLLAKMFGVMMIFFLLWVLIAG